MIAMIRALLRPWTWTMAWRESRQRRRRLALFGSSIVLGIAALTAIGSLRDQIDQSIEVQAKSLLGADLVLAGRSRFGVEEEALFRSIGGEQAREVDFSSMVIFPASRGTRLVQVRVIEGDFPFYGELESLPQGSLDRWRETGGALVEESLLAQFQAQVGDDLRVGDLSLKVVGRLQRVPGDSMAFATLAPRVYLRKSDLARGNLLREGSLARYKVYFRLAPGESAEAWAKQLKPELDRLRLGHTTVEKRQEDLGDSMENLANFLSLIGFVALLLGGIGVSSAIHTHIREKLPGVAMLRCLGASQTQTFSIYLAQAMALGVLASLVGVILGLATERVLPWVMGDFLQLKINSSLNLWRGLQGLLLGTVFCLIFALLPLLAVRRTSPLAALRLAAGSEGGRRVPWDAVAVYLLILFAAGTFAVQHTQKWRHGIGFALGLLVAFALLASLARGLMLAARGIAPRFLPFAGRQGVANLHRPNNRTTLLMLSLGLGTFVLLTLYLAQNTLLTQLIKDRGSDRPNTIFFDIQPDQQAGVTELLQSRGIPLMEQAPIVTMRLSKLKERTVDELLADTNRVVAKWALRREYRSTWRAELANSESLLVGSWHPPFDPSREFIPVSVEEGIARELGVGLGDELVFDLQGVPLSTRVASLRKVDWRRMQPNFFVVFPPGSLEGAPAFHVFVTRTKSAEESAEIQRSVVERFPNVSAIDLTLVLNTLDAILSKVSLALRFMALFTVATGLLVLAGAVLVSRHQRMKESVLLRTLGASRAQLQRILVWEYASLGFLAGSTGTILAIAASWALAHFVFRTSYLLSVVPILIAPLSVALLTVATGLLSSRTASELPPLELLREEAS
jgi:putative ABC transport system permease protein